MLSNKCESKGNFIYSTKQTQFDLFLLKLQKKTILQELFNKSLKFKHSKIAVYYFYFRFAVNCEQSKINNELLSCYHKTYRNLLRYVIKTMLTQRLVK